MRHQPTIEYLRECFSLDNITGILTWNTRPSSHFRPGKRSSETAACIWNTRYSGIAAGSRGDGGYLRVRIAGKIFMAHRVIVAITLGAWPNELYDVDHKNGVTHDNRPSNLRVVSKSMNQQNRTYLDKRNTSGVAGVVWCKQSSKWRAVVSDPSNGKQKVLGVFERIDQAAAARRYFVENCYAGFIQHAELRTSDLIRPPRYRKSRIGNGPEVKA